MSISTNSINCGDDFTSAENGEVNGAAISLDNDGQFDENSESISDQQKLKEFREKFAKMGLKMAKLELENKVLEQKLKHQELMVEQEELKEKVAKIEQKKEKNATSDQFSKMQNDQKILFEKVSELEKQQKEQSKASADQFSKIMQKISEMEKQQKQQHKNTTKATSDQLSKMQNDQKFLLEKVNELKKEQKLRKALLNFRQNYWDANACHEKLEIIGEKNSTIHNKGNYNALKKTSW